MADDLVVQVDAADAELAAAKIALEQAYEAHESARERLQTAFAAQQAAYRAHQDAYIALPLYGFRDGVLVRYSAEETQATLDRWAANRAADMARVQDEAAAKELAAEAEQAKIAAAVNAEIDRRKAAGEL